MALIRRSVMEPIREDLARKIVLVTGPRQGGKTTLARALTADHEYIDYDYAPHLMVLRERSWDRRKPLLVLDEPHTMPLPMRPWSDS